MNQWLPVYISLLTPIATLAVVLVGFLYNNARMNDLQGSLTARLSDFKDLLRAETAKNEANLARVESALLSKFSELDTRLSRIESHLNLSH